MVEIMGYIGKTHQTVFRRIIKVVSGIVTHIRRVEFLSRRVDTIKLIPAQCSI